MKFILGVTYIVISQYDHTLYEYFYFYEQEQQASSTVMQFSMLFPPLRASPIVSTNLKTLANIAKPTPNMQNQHLNRQFLGCYSNCSLGRLFSSTMSPLSLSPSLSLTFSSPTLAMPFSTRQLAARFLESNLYLEHQQKVCLSVPLILNIIQGFREQTMLLKSLFAFYSQMPLGFVIDLLSQEYFALSLCIFFFYYCFVSCISTCIWVTNFLLLLCSVMFWGKIFIDY